MNADDLFGPIVTELCKAVALLGGMSDILAIVGSWRDTQADAETLAMLREWVETERITRAELARPA